ncbi:MAG: hypothetical protein U9R79_07445 [Armatimonadota bacterium]|nr:hypothetical protein [Armatimonadota bacterium]
MRQNPILERIDQLLEEAQTIHGSVYVDTAPIREKVDEEAFRSWSVSCSHVISLAFGRESEHYRAFDREISDFYNLFRNFARARAVLKAAREDLAAGMLVKLEDLAAAEVFDDMLEMALHLHESGYHIAAVSITGAVLEDALRKLHAREIGSVADESKISVLNDALKDVYGQPTWRQIQTWGDIRNDADHGKYSNSEQQKALDANGEPYPVIDPRQVRRMIDWTRDFMEKHLTYEEHSAL